MSARPQPIAARRDDPARVETVRATGSDDSTLEALDAPTRALVRLAAVVAIGDEPALRAALAESFPVVPPVWVEELILQSYLFAGFPRALNAMREWRRVSGRRAPVDDAIARHQSAATWAADGEVTCAEVYGPFYERLRVNIATLHPALDEWMIVEGYGKVLSRPGLDLVRRELCVMAVCAVARQDRQLHSHLHGALHVGATPRLVEEALAALREYMTPADHDRAMHLWSHVRTTQSAR